MSDLTMEKLKAACRMIPPDLYSAGPASMPVQISPHIEPTYIGEYIYPAHRLVRWLCRWFKLSPWTHAPMYRQDAVMIHNRIYMSPEGYDTFTRGGGRGDHELWRVTR